MLPQNSPPPTNRNNVELVNALTHPLAINIRALLGRAERQSRNQILIDDEDNILQALDAKIVLHHVFTSDKGRLSPTFCKRLPTSIPVSAIAHRTSKKLFGNDRLSRVFAIAELPPPLSLDSLSGLKKDIVVLDRLSISGNVGSIIRTAMALGVDGLVFLESELVDVLDRRIIRSSRGYVFKIPVITASTGELLAFCQANKLDMLVTSPYAREEIEDVIDHQGRLALVVGSEKEGCSQALLSHASLSAKIPLLGGIESLNVSVATSIFLYRRSLYYKNIELPRY